MNGIASISIIKWWITMIMVVTVLGNIENSDAKLTVSLSKKHGKASHDALMHVNFCVDCPTPHLEGSAAIGLKPKFVLPDYHAVGTLVYCVPNNAASKKILNGHHFRDRIVLVDRGNIGILDKIEKIQEKDAIGVIIADDGRCREDFTFCGPQAGSVQEGGFSIYDDPNRWRSVNIPVVLVSVQTADAMRRLMGIRQVNIPKLGTQNLTIFHFGKESFKDEL